MKKFAALFAAFLLVFLFGCAQGQGQDVEEIQDKADALNASLLDCRDNLTALQAQYDALADGSSSSQEQVSELEDQVSSLESEVDEEKDKSSFALRQANSTSFRPTPFPW